MRYIGERDLERRPVRGDHVIIEHESKMETFRIDMIVPDHWQQSDGVPTITVVQGQGD